MNIFFFVKKCNIKVKNDVSIDVTAVYGFLIPNNEIQKK